MDLYAFVFLAIPTVERRTKYRVKILGDYDESRRRKADRALFRRLEVDDDDYDAASLSDSETNETFDRPTSPNNE